MKNILLPIGLLIMLGCASQKANTTTGAGDTQSSQPVFLNDNTYLLTEASNDETYGYKKSNPIKVGGSRESAGPTNERRFLNALLGPNGEEVRYLRTGSCCPFKTPNGLIDNTGMLDRYRITWTGTQDTLDLFINMYDKGDLQIPVRLTARK
jgi:hypothetical protein